MAQLSPEQIAKLKEIAKLPPEEQKKKLPAFLQSLSPEQLAALKSAQPECLFCKIIAGEIPAYTVYENNHVLAFLDIKPANPGHVLVVPKRHYQILPQMPDEEVAALFKAVKLLLPAIFESTGAEGITVRQRNGAVAGQVVPHVHVHIIPRFKNDGIEHDWKPRELAKEQFEEIQKRIKAKIPLQPKSEQKSEKMPKIPPRIP